jgi:hypothetical protein
MLDEDTRVDLEELGWNVHKLAEVAGYYDIPSKVSQWQRAGKLPSYIKALLDAHVRIHRLVEYNDERKPGTYPVRRRRKVTPADIEAYFTDQNKSI